MTVSSIGDARSLQGGTLLATPLRGTDGAVYALAQGALTLGGFGGGRGGNSVQVNHLTAGRVPSGGLVQAATPQSDLVPARSARAQSATTRISPARIAWPTRSTTISGRARPRRVDAGTVNVRVPPNTARRCPSLMARLEPLPLTMDAVARVVINERTGTVVVGQGVRLSPAAVAHGNLSVRITHAIRSVAAESAVAGRRDRGRAATRRSTSSEGANRLIALEEGTTLDAVVRALNALGATPRDIIAIVQALKAAGALNAAIVIL